MPLHTSKPLCGYPAPNTRITTQIAIVLSSQTAVGSRLYCNISMAHSLTLHLTSRCWKWTQWASISILPRIIDHGFEHTWLGGTVYYGMTFYVVRSFQKEVRFILYSLNFARVVNINDRIWCEMLWKFRNICNNAFDTVLNWSPLNVLTLIIIMSRKSSSFVYTSKNKSIGT